MKNWGFPSFLMKRLISRPLRNNAIRFYDSSRPLKSRRQLPRSSSEGSLLIQSSIRFTKRSKHLAKLSNHSFFCATLMMESSDRQSKSKTINWKCEQILKGSVVRPEPGVCPGDQRGAVGSRGCKRLIANAIILWNYLY